MNTKALTLPVQSLQNIEGWAELTADERLTVKEETALFNKAMLQAGKARLAAGQHLYHVREILKPKRMWEQYLASTHFSRATANRYIDTYTAAKTILPAPVLKVAMLRGNDTINAKLIEATPPPKTGNVVAINKWFDKLETGKSNKGEDRDNKPDSLKRECYQFIHSRFQRLPHNSKTRAAWVHSLSGMLLAELGVSGAQSIEPVAVPESYRPRPKGRPAKAKEVAA